MSKTEMENTCKLGLRLAARDWQKRWMQMYIEKYDDEISNWIKNLPEDLR